jgi:hypothetical protein
MRAMIAAVFAAGFCSIASAEEPDPVAGERLVERHCQGCHQSEVYTRADRRIRNLNQLRNQVQRCEQNLALKWFDTDIEDVTAYLNQAYYGF